MNKGGEGSHPDMTMETATRERLLVLFVGLDTTATALANVIFYLTPHPDTASRLRSELDVAEGEGISYDVDIQVDRLVELKYLQAIINETLRLQPGA